jgi:hypothetical protein
MEKLITELGRLYLPAGVVTDAVWNAHLHGAAPLVLAGPDGAVRAAALAFPVLRDQEEGRHWSRLCEVANELQTRLGLPAPAVSVSGDNGYCLWLSLEQPMPAAEVGRLLALLHAAVMPDLPAPGHAAPLPPCLHPASGKWSAFIHPGMGASFADGSGLEMAPPLAGQVAFLEGLHSITPDQVAHLLQQLQPAPAASAPPPQQRPAAAPGAPGLLLKDASLEDIVAYLHGKNIEPTFRFLK